MTDDEGSDASVPAAAAGKAKKKGKSLPNVNRNKKTTGEEPHAARDGELDDDDDSPRLALGQQYVDHAYVDYAVVADGDLRLLDENSSLLPPPADGNEAKVREKLKGMSCTYGPMKKNAGGVVRPFPGKLIEVLDRPDLSEVIDWMPHGRAFLVRKPKPFTTDVLPRFFRQTKFLSFTRQLNLWGFKRITRGIDAGAYYHELFLRGRPYLAMRMRRQKIKGTGMKLTPNPDGEPDFYNDWPALAELSENRVVPPLPPLPAERIGEAKTTKASAKKGGAVVADRADSELLKALQQQHQNKPGGGMDSVSENMLNALKYGGAAGGMGMGAANGMGMSGMGTAGLGGMAGGPTADNMSSLLAQKNFSNLSSAFGNQMSHFQQFAAMGAGHHATPASLSSITSMAQHAHAAAAGPPRYSGGAPGAPGSNYDDLLLAPGVRSGASRLHRLSQHHPSSGGGGGAGATPGADVAGGFNPSDPIHDELSSMVRKGYQSSPAAAAPAPGQLSSDRLLMERLRDLDRAQQGKREPGPDGGMSRDATVGMLSHHRARLLEEWAGGPLPSSASAGGPGGGGMPSASSASLGANGAGLGPLSPYDGRYAFPPAPRAAGPSLGLPAGAGKGPDPFAGLGSNPVESSVKDALREANHLEELALAQRAKARSLALAGALQSRFGGVGGGLPGAMDPSRSQPPLPSPLKKGVSHGSRTSSENDGATGGDSRPSFGRPFGRKD